MYIVIRADELGTKQIRMQIMQLKHENAYRSPITLNSAVALNCTTYITAEGMLGLFFVLKL
jgi:hypothetical protein